MGVIWTPYGVILTPQKLKEIASSGNLNLLTLDTIQCGVIWTFSNGVQVTPIDVLLPENCTLGVQFTPIE